MRREEFDCQEQDVLEAVLRRAKVGHLAFLRGGDLELLPYNFCWNEGYVYFHSSPHTGLAATVSNKIRFLAYDDVAWIPSTWRHPELACPATTYYCSVSFESEFEEVTSLAEKAKVLEMFMHKYQASDTYAPLDEARYEGPLKALFVGRLKVRNAVVKLKMGQHLTPKQRAKVFEHLEARSRPGDRQTAHTMALANPDLRRDDWVTELTENQLESVTRLLRDTYWASDRTVEEQRSLNLKSEVLIAKCKGDEVLAFARVILLSPSTGYLADVVVDPYVRGEGLGRELMDRITKHSKVSQLTRFWLVTKDAGALYEKFGFELKFSSSTNFMVREITQHAHC